ncbi:MAG: hypothetical protein KIT07_10280 [Anaerolineales bacterium]|nr:hypothetical protein [Anaerolineales bacterium]
MNEKVYRVLVVVLLAAILAVQFLPKDQISEGCAEAVAGGRAIVDRNATRLGNLLDEYQNAAYTEAENINHQIFFANEFQVIALVIISQQNAALLDVIASCQ